MIVTEKGEQKVYVNVIDHMPKGRYANHMRLKLSLNVFKNITKTCPYNLHRFFFSAVEIKKIQWKNLIFLIFLLKT